MAEQKRVSESQFADEEIQSDFGYASGYQPKRIADQVARLRELFPELNTADAGIAGRALPQHAEGWFALPRWEKVAATYNAAVEKVLALIKKTRDGRLNETYYDYAVKEFGTSLLRQHERTTAAFEKLGDQQADHDILIVAAQFGLRHRGRSVRRARAVFDTHEFDLGAFAVGSMLLTHPERLMGQGDLHIYCAGDECDSPGYRPPYSQHVPDFGFDHGNAYIDFGTCWIANGSDVLGSATGFLS